MHPKILRWRRSSLIPENFSSGVIPLYALVVEQLSRYTDVLAASAQKKEGTPIASIMLLVFSKMDRFCLSASPFW